MRTKIILALAGCLPFSAHGQVTVTGTWKADDVAFAPWTFVLKADGHNLTGTVSQGRSDPAASMVTNLVQPVEITDGAIDGSRLSFKVNANGNTISFSGVVNGDTITFTREVVSGASGLNGIFGVRGASRFTAKFVSPSTELQAGPAAALAPKGSVNTGMRIVFLGTGTPVVDPDRSGPAVAVVAGGKSYLIDAGPGVVRRASSAARATGLAPLLPVAMTTLFLTHLHSDHTLGYPDLIFTPAVTGRGMPLEVYGPKGTQDMTDHLLAAWKKDIDVRVNGLEHGNPNAYRVNVHEIKPGQVYQDGNVKVTAFLVKHGSWDEAFGYRFDGAGRRMVISGDTSPTQAIVDACSGCDVLVHEVYCGTATPGSYNAAFHTAAAELIDVAKQARPKLLILYHQLYGGCTDAALIEQVQAGFSGTVVSAKDFDIF